ncbi:hypothetical protein H4N58_08805 [Mumia sp. ZJ1417]|uniref:hypothetical protein n=1 Tax=Mumia sp. ZJ1417 TaxID=2708082 RepID=UPI001423ED62|nr:hypothetical protein [Mumia sp. ZJ1417]QMW67925.1 hypothetical protein H4N58_08805 [Mumia sp. ZJ1417]
MLATSAVGNHLTISKDTFRWDVLAALEKIEWAEDAYGDVQPPRQLTGAGLPELPEITAEQRGRMRQIYDI